MKQLKWKWLIISAFMLLASGLLLAQKTIIDISYNKDYVSEQGWTVWQSISDESVLPTGFGFRVTSQDVDKGVLFINNTDAPVWLGGNKRMKDDFWFTYTLSGMKVGASYDIEANIELANASTCIQLTAWTEDHAPAAKTVLNNQTTATGNVYKASVIATASTMTFGIGTGATNPNANDHYSRNILNTWKITENALEEYAITYHHVGSKNFEDNPNTYNIGTSDVGLEAPYDSLGYVFAGWFTDAAFANAVATPAIAQGSTGAKDFYAKWEVAALQGEVGISGIAKAGRTLTAVADDIENNTGDLSYQWQSGDGSSFVNISGATAPAYTLTDNEAGQYMRVLVSSSIQTGTLQSTTAQRVLDASVATYVITYNANGGNDGFITAEEIAEGSSAIVAASPQRKGYKLTGWNTAANGSGSAFSSNSAVGGDMTVYAQWAIITYTVDFDNDGAYANKTTDIESALLIDLPVAPTQEGYAFAGWNTQADGRGDVFTASTEVLADMTVYAQWDMINYTVNFDAEGNYATLKTNIERAYKVSLPEAPSKEGYTFKNWNTQADGMGTTFSSETLIDADITVYAQWREIINAIPIAVNLNMKHSVDGVSDFGRERHITSHTSNTESDWEGHEEMMDYFFNELDVYGGRDNGSAGWKNKMVTEDPNKVHWPDLESIKSVGSELKNWYEGNDYTERHQYEGRRGNMIMGLNPHAVYPSMDWTNFSKMNSGWQTYDVDAAAYFIANYLDQNFAKTTDEIGEPLPVYWECMNEPDMAVMASSAMFLSSFEKIYEFHNLSAIEIRKVLGDKAPKIGGFTWGQHDLWGADFINRWSNAETTYYNYSDESIFPAYDNMWLGYDGKGTRATGSTLFQARKESWWQWDALYQEFMETCGEQMDFYSFHFYDWPKENDGGIIRAGGPIEASLDMVESFDIDRFGKRKEAIVSEFGTVSQELANTLPYYRRDWENLRPFNQMFMQFLERPSHLRLTMPFAPIKAIWGDWWNDDGSLQQRYASTMMDPVGDYKAPGYDHKEWQWSGMILWYELWKDVKGTRIDTKSPNPDIQVDAYVDGKHVYLILNNLEISEEYLNLSLFGADDNIIKGVKLTHQYLDEDQTETGWPVNEVHTMASLPAQVKLAKSATMILDIEYEDEIVIDEESKEKKYVSERLSNEKNRFGRDKYYVESLSGELTTHINGVTVPTIGEASLRVGVRIQNGVKANVSINGTSILAMTNQSEGLNVRGRELYRGAGGFFCVMELDVPLDILKEDNEVVLSIPHSRADISSVQLQVWDMTTEPGRFDESQDITPTAISLSGESTLMQGKTVALEALFTPANATNKSLEWSSSDPSILSVDQYGVVTAHAASGNADITATSLVDGNVFATQSISATALQSVAVTGIQIEQGDFMTVEYYTNTALTAKILPENADMQDVVWSSSKSRYVSVFENNGKVVGKSIGKTEYIYATVTDGENSFTDSIQIYVTVMGGESLFNRLLPEVMRPYPSASLPIVARAFGERQISIAISKDNTIIASGDTTLNFSGDKTVYVPYTLTGTPELDATYEVTFTLKDGETTLDTKTGNITMIDHIHATSIAISDGIRVVMKSKTISLSASILPEDTYNKTMTWTTLNSTIASVDPLLGIVTGLSEGKAEIVVTAEDGSLSDTVEITVQNEEVVVPITHIVMQTSKAMFPESVSSIAFELQPSWTTETRLAWSTSDANIASVNQQGVVTTNTSLGTVSITVASTETPSVSATCIITVSERIVVEAEDFDNTGGDHEGFNVNEAQTGISHNQSGDWVEYEVYFPKTANYKTRYYIGAPSANTGISAKLYVDGSLAHTTTFSPTGAWDTMHAFTSSATPISEGWHTIRIVSAGTSDWQWNADRYEFFISGTSAIESIVNTKIKLYPNPVQDVLSIEGEQLDYCKIYGMTGQTFSALEVHNNSINTSALPSGIYFLELYYGKKKSTHKLIVQH